MQQIQHFINGQFLAHRSGRSFEKRSPLTGGLLAQVADQGRPGPTGVSFAMQKTGLLQCAGTTHFLIFPC
jgi:hypothetical protein